MSSDQSKEDRLESTRSFRDLPEPRQLGWSYGEFEAEPWSSLNSRGQKLTCACVDPQTVLEHCDDSAR